MKTTQHTTGPWEIGRSYSSTHATPIRWQGENLAWVCGTDSAHEFSKEQTAANARLIACAPELYALVRAYATTYPLDDYQDVARALQTAREPDRWMGGEVGETRIAMRKRATHE